MKRFNLLVSLVLITTLSYAGFNIGMPGAVKNKVNALDKQVEKKVIKDLEDLTDDTVTQEDTDGPDDPADPGDPGDPDPGNPGDPDPGDPSNGAWVDEDGAGIESMLVSSVPEGHNFSYRNTSMCLDAGGNPFIAWQQNVFQMINQRPNHIKSDICLLKWDGSSWVDVDGAGTESMNISNTAGFSKLPAVKVDSNGNPHLVWSEGGRDIYYVQWNGSLWVDADGSGLESINISNSSGNSNYPSLSIGTDNNPRIAWADATEGDSYLYYMAWNGTSWVDADGNGKESINISYPLQGSSASMCLDTADNPHFAWANSNIYYLKWNGTEWVDVDGAGRESPMVYVVSYHAGYLGLCVNNAGMPRIVWKNTISESSATKIILYHDIYFMQWNGTNWVDADGTGMESVNITDDAAYAQGPTLSVDSNGNPHVAWRRDDSLYYMSWNGSGWVDADGSGIESRSVSDDFRSNTSQPSLCLDNNSNPHIAWSVGAISLGRVYCIKWGNND